MGAVTYNARIVLFGGLNTAREYSFEAENQLLSRVLELDTAPTQGGILVKIISHVHQICAEVQKINAPLQGIQLLVFSDRVFHLFGENEFNEIPLHDQTERPIILLEDRPEPA